MKTPDSDKSLDQGHKARQLALELAHGQGGQMLFSKADFVIGAANAQAYALVESWPDWPHAIAMLHGPRSAGKSHLASIWVQNADAFVLAADQISIALSGLVAGKTSGSAILVEDINNSDLDEEGLFHLINHCLEASASLLLTADLAPGQLDIVIPDLASRLRAANTAEIGLPDGDMLENLLVKLFADRQIDLAPKAAAFAIARMERSFADAVSLVETVDRMALEEGRSITIPLLRAYFEGLEIA